MIKPILATAAIMLSSIPASFAGPTLAYGTKTVLYSQIACIQKAEAKLNQIYATNVQKNNVINIFGEYPKTTIGIMCRQNEVFVSVAGEDAFLFRDEVLSSF